MTKPRPQTSGLNYLSFSACTKCGLLYIDNHSSAKRAIMESKKMYEWETQVDRNAIEINKINMRNEIKRINEVVRSGNFVKQEDREYWIQKAKQLNSKLSALEEVYK